MSLSQEEINEAKSQLKSQVSHLPQDKKVQALKQIDEMSSEAIEALIEQQKQQSSFPVYRKIVDSEIPSTKVEENSSAIAVLDNKPISKGHTIIIPKEQVKSPKDMPQEAFKLAESLSKKITENLKASSVRAETETKFGEVIINLIPIYDKPLTITSPRTETSPEDLQKVKQELEIIKLEKKVEVIKKEVPKRTHVIKLKRRIP